MSIHEATQRVADCMDQILTNFKDGAKITVLVRYPNKPKADFCLTDDNLDEVIAMVQRRKGEAPPQPKMEAPSEKTTKRDRQRLQSAFKKGVKEGRRIEREAQQAQISTIAEQLTEADR